jgi:hypothetical protein
MEGFAVMNKFIPALVATLGLAAVSVAVPAQARVVVGIGLPGVALVAPPVVLAPGFGGYGAYAGYGSYYYGHPYYRPGFARFGYGYRGYGFHGYGRGGYRR